MALSVVGIVCALASEARHLGPTTRRHETSIASLADGTLLAVTGMGATAAAQGAQALIEAGATALASWGMAGGLDPALAAGAILLPGEVVGLDGTSVESEPGWRQRLAEALRANHPVAPGRLLTSPRAIGSPAEKAALFQSTAASAVDMESLAIAHVASGHHLPFMAVRVIVDSAEDVLPQAVTVAADSEGHLHVWRLIGALARAPSDIAPLIRLARRYRAANRSLAAVARMSPWGPFAFPTPRDAAIS